MMDFSSGRTCRQCGQQKPSSEFSWKGTTKRRLSYRCHACRSAAYHENPHAARERAKAWYHANRERSRAVGRARRVACTALCLLSSARKRAKDAGLPFDLTPADIRIPELCPILGMPLVVNEGRSGPNSPTIDRVRPELGYVRGNVVVISHRANTIKSDATLAELRAVVAYVERELAGDEWSALAVAVTAAQTEAE